MAGSTTSSTRSRCEGKRGLAGEELTRLRARLGGEPRADLFQPGLDFLEREALLLVLVGPELLRLLAEAPATKRLQDRGQPRDLGLRRRIGLREVVDLRLQLQDFAARGLRFRLGLVGASGVGERQRFEFVNVVGKLAGALDHADMASIFADESPAFSAVSKHFPHQPALCGA